MRRQPWIRLSIVTMLAGALTALPAQQTTQPAGKNQQPDNTRVNRADRSEGGVTADQAKNDRSDREIMKKVRKEILADKSLSTYAHNVKVIADHGKVTLKGPVHTDEERNTIEAKAASVVGAENVKNDITVKTDTRSDNSRH